MKLIRIKLYKENDAALLTPIKIIFKIIRESKYQDNVALVDIKVNGVSGKYIITNYSRVKWFEIIHIKINDPIPIKKLK